MTIVPNVRINVGAPFPALVTGGSGIGVSKTNGIWTVTLLPGAIASVVQGLGFAQGQIIGTNTNDNASPGNIGEYFRSLATGATATVTSLGGNAITWTAHGLAGNTVVTFTNSGGALPTGLTAGTAYYVVGSTITANTFQVATTIANAIAGTVVTITGAGTGTHTGTNSATLATTVARDLGAVQLTPGDWDVWGVVSFLGNAATTVSALAACVSPTSVTQVAPPTGGCTHLWYSAALIFNAANSTEVTVSPIRVSISVNTVYYLVAQSTFATNSEAAYGFLQARRVR